jgi:7-carboxy-7-deazaguanine synthase (Cx14CxxC type)
MSYSVKEIFYTLQGEGAQAGRPAVFCRFAGCNLWTGREEDRAEAQCRFCDTEFVGADAGRFETPDALADAIATLWPRDAPGRAYVVCTGGEPLLQLDEALCRAFHAHGFEVGVETNGTQPRPLGIDWLCVSPKAKAQLVLDAGDELKLVFPQAGLSPNQFLGLAFDHFFLQPMDGPDRLRNTEAAIAFCLQNPRWRLGLQMHKVVGLR